jgi:hypothetical protein
MHFNALRKTLPLYPPLVRGLTTAHLAHIDGIISKKGAGRGQATVHTMIHGTVTRANVHSRGCGLSHEELFFLLQPLNSAFRHLQTGFENGFFIFAHEHLVFEQAGSARRAGGVLLACPFHML